MYDFISPSRVFQLRSIQSTSTSGAGGWANTIQRAYEGTDSAINVIEYPSLLSTSRSATLLFRVKIKNTGEDVASCIFRNGTIDTDGYGVFFDSRFAEIRFKHLDDTGEGDMKIIGSSIAYNTWYHFAIRFDTVTVSAVDITTVTAIMDGTITVDAVSFNSPILVPTGATTLFAVTTGSFGFFGFITDFVFLETQLSNERMINFATAPYR